MEESRQPSATFPPAVLVAAGSDRFGEQLGLPMSSIAIKASTQDSEGLFILENTFRAKGGPARHLHYDQDEWFYVVEGEFIFEVGAERFQLNSGDALLAPRRVPHVWGYTGAAVGRILVAFMPAGRMEAIFREVMQAGTPPPRDPAVWHAYGMQLLGPPLQLE